MGKKYGAEVWITETVAVLILIVIGSVIIEQVVGLTNIEGVNFLTVFGLLFGFGMTIGGRLRTVTVSFSPIHGMFDVKVGGVFLVASNIMAGMNPIYLDSSLFSGGQDKVF